MTGRSGRPVAQIQGVIELSDELTAAGGVRVLVAEDNPLSSELMRDHLTLLGYSVDCAEDGNRTLVMASSGDYRVLLLDVNMPIYNGVEVLRLLRRRQASSPIKVIVVTADRLASRREELMSEGIDGYLTKPVDLDRLAGELHRVLEEQPQDG